MINTLYSGTIEMSSYQNNKVVFNGEIFYSVSVSIKLR